jgi:hypothetical protein
MTIFVVEKESFRRPNHRRFLVTNHMKFTSLVNRTPVFLKQGWKRGWKAGKGLLEFDS